MLGKTWARCSKPSIISDTVKNQDRRQFYSPGRGYLKACRSLEDINTTASVINDWI